MKKVLILLASTILLFGCLVRDRGFSEIYAGDYSKVTRLVIHRGAIGGGIQETREITAEEEIRSFFDLLNSTRFVRMKDQSAKVNFLYSVDVYENDENPLSIIFTEETARLGSTNYWLDKNVGKDLKLLFGSGVQIKF